MIEDSLPLKPPLDALLGISVPRLYFTAVMHIEKHVEEDHKTNHEEAWEEGNTSHLFLPSATSKCLTLTCLMYIRDNIKIGVRSCYCWIGQAYIAVVCALGWMYLEVLLRIVPRLT